MQSGVAERGNHGVRKAAKDIRMKLDTISQVANRNSRPQEEGNQKTVSYSMTQLEIS